ncbi:MAG: HD domain-containing protein [Bacteroidales bacterium]
MDIKKDILKQKNSFAEEATFLGCPKWEVACSRLERANSKPDEIRTEFNRDDTRILHSMAYGRLKSKTQVFFHTHSDRICTRIEHVNHVTSVSGTMARFLGLNEELTHAISLGHDLGHAPFGHSGEKILNDLSQKGGLCKFWHEKNSLHVVDDLELLQDTNGHYKNLNLSYAVRDGIISHCGEVNEKSLYPRSELVDLKGITHANMYAPYTWEGCVVKISDKISYLGRDIEDALCLKILDNTQLADLKKIIQVDVEVMNNTNLIHAFITDLCKNSSPEVGIRFSAPYLEMMKEIMRFNYTHIYNHKRLKNYESYARLVLSSIYEILSQAYRAEDTLYYLLGEFRALYPKLGSCFGEWLQLYVKNIQLKESSYKRLYDLNDRENYQ